MSCKGGLLGQEHHESHCRETGFGLSMELTSALSGLRGTLWYDIALWEMATIQGRSIQEIVGLFVTEGVEAVLGPDPVTGETQRFGLLVEDCAGPNCIRDPETTAQHACQPLFEIQSTYEEVGESLRIVCFVYVALFVLLGLVIRTKHGGRILAQILHFPATHSCFSVHKGRVGKKEPVESNSTFNKNKKKDTNVLSSVTTAYTASLSRSFKGQQNQNTHETNHAEDLSLASAEESNCSCNDLEAAREGRHLEEGEARSVRQGACDRTLACDVNTHGIVVQGLTATVMSESKRNCLGNSFFRHGLQSPSESQEVKLLDNIHFESKPGNRWVP